MKILVINAGSSSLKFTCFRMDDHVVLAQGLVERIGLSGTELHYKNHEGDVIHEEVDIRETADAVERVTRHLLDEGHGVISDKADLTAVGHRVVHGGEKITRTVIVDEPVKGIIRECIEMAPLHNPPNLAGIVAMERQFPELPQVAVFDTAFHATMPPHAFLYGLPYEMYESDKIRRYGFHGTSHAYVSREADRILGLAPGTSKIVTCHLGNGCSISAVRGGRCVDTSMGFTPLEGLIMGTRCGDLDPAIVLYLMEHEGLDYAHINNLLNKKSGLLGMAGIGSSDLRDILAARERGHERADIALTAFTYRIRKYIGAYQFAMGGLDAIVFTAGIGENSPLVRRLVCEGLEGIGIIIDDEKNDTRGTVEVQAEGGRVDILVIPTNEELEIALQTGRVLRESGRA